VSRIHWKNIMPEGLWPILVLIALVIVYTIAKVRQHMRKSEEQWQQVDKSKLREWDDDDWPQD
jgi:hypothetical protein